ncbi:MAG: pyruvate kinase alpha/beta domain-containing protein [Planctomycetota bacterium]
MESRITYFESAGEENTEKTLQLARQKALDADVDRVVLASTTGGTARMAHETFEGDDIQLVVIPHQFGFDEPENKFPQELTDELEEAGHTVHWGTMLFHTGNLYQSHTPDALANILRCFCQGIKVCFEVSLMAADAGHVATGEQIIAVAGTGRGADTAIYATASNTQDVDGFRVHHILCMPE